MNRLVIIGNGFDLAHGLPTRYKDFIDDYWSSIKSSEHNEMVKFNFNTGIKFDSNNNFNDLANNLIRLEPNAQIRNHEVFIQKQFGAPNVDNREQIIIYKNDFFKIINYYSLNNWVDIENLYYELLKDVFKGINNRYSGTISKLNKDFEEIKKLFN
jgi:hypothetical protein